MEQVAVRLRKIDGWTWLAGNDDAKKPPEVVVRAFEGAVLAASGSSDLEPEGEPILVPEGEGRRLTGRHFFVRPAPPAGPRLVSYRGI